MFFQFSDDDPLDGQIMIFGTPAAGISAITWKYQGASLDPVIGDPDSVTPATKDYYGGTLIFNAAGTFALPAAVSGMNFTVKLEGANAVILNPDATGTEDTIYLNGAAKTQGEAIDSSTSGSMCVFQYRSADAWSASCTPTVWTGE